MSSATRPLNNHYPASLLFGLAAWTLTSLTQSACSSGESAQGDDASSATGGGTLTDLGGESGGNAGTPGGMPDEPNAPGSGGDTSIDDPSQPPLPMTYCDRWRALAPGDLPGFATSSVCNDFSEVPLGDAECRGATNDSASIERLELAQNHVLTPSAADYTTKDSGEPLDAGSVRPQFRLISHRPALLLVGVTGSGTAPDVRVTARRDGEEVGSFCLSGPEDLPTEIGAAPDGGDRFTVSLPADWIRSGLELEVAAGAATRLIPATDLRVAGGTRHIVMEGSMQLYGKELQLVPQDSPDVYLMSDELPVQSAVWAHFPVPIVMDPMTMSAKSGNPARILTEAEGGFDEVGECLDIFAEIRRANGHIEDTGYFAALPDGWGGGLGGGNGSAGPASQLMIRHEGGHAYGLPHMENAYEDGRYPFAKRSNGSGCVLGVPGEDGCGVGPAWKFFQSRGVFESPWEDQGAGVYKRDPMAGGGNNWFGAYTDQWLLDYFRHRPYFDLKDGVYKRYDEGSGEFVPDTEVDGDNYYRRPIERDTPVYTLFGSYSDETDVVNVIQPPLHYRGHLLRTIDPTSDADLDQLRALGVSTVCQRDCDFVLRVTFDGALDYTVLVARDARSYTRWAVNVPDLGTVTRAELYRRDVSDGNIEGIAGANFLDFATLVASREF